MVKILFVCHGNICRSPMAEYIMKKICLEKHINIVIDSKATSTEEIGNTIYYEAKNILRKHNIPYNDRKAMRIEKNDYEYYDLIICMDHYNLTNIKRIIPYDHDHKIYLLRSFTGLDLDIDDPWYTRDFETCYKQIYENCTALLDYIIKTKAL